MIKVLFLIHDLGQGGAEKVLVNLVNHMDSEQFDITVMALFAGGVNEQFLCGRVKYRTVYQKTLRGNSHLMKLLTPEQLHRRYIHEKYDIEISYLEGPSARIISGCPDKGTKLVSWIHSTMTEKAFSASFRSRKEAVECYSRFDLNVGVSRDVQKAFQDVSGIREKGCVLYNTIDSDRIRVLMNEPAEEIENDGRIKLVAVGSLKEGKGFERLLTIIGRLKKEQENISKNAEACLQNNLHLYILGRGPLKEKLEDIVKTEDISDEVAFLGYQTNPYKYMVKCDLYVCPSYSEGFSTAATEALLVGIPVCTTDVSGMRELLGEDSTCGLITENTDEALYQGIKQLVSDPELLGRLKNDASERGKMFDAEQTTMKAEAELRGLLNG